MTVHHPHILMTLSRSMSLKEVFAPQKKKNVLEKPPKHLKTYGERSFSYAAPDVWNQLPQDVKSSETIAIFKKRLKTYLFTCNFCNT